MFVIGRFFALLSLLSLGACATSQDRQMSANPLASASALPYALPDYSRISDDHLGAAIELGMAEHRAEVARIIANPDAPSFANTLIALEKSGRTLDRATRVFYALNAADTNPGRQAVEADIGPKLAAHIDAILLDPALFARVEAIYNQRASLNLDPESAWLLDRSYRDFVNAGARLSEEQKTRLKNLNRRLSELTTVFSQQLRADTNQAAVLVESAAELEGLTESEINALAAAAKAAGHEQGYLVSLILPTNQPALARLSNRKLRQRIYLASIQRGQRGNANDNRQTVLELVRLRAERAELLGYESHAAAQLVEQTAGTVSAVDQLLGKIVPAATRAASKEAAALQKLIDAEGGGFRLAPWDWSYYAEQLRTQKYAFDESALQPYFELGRVLNDGVFFMAEKLYGLSFKLRLDLPTYHPDVRAYEVFNAAGEGIGLFLFDPYARPSKRGGAWMNSHVAQSRLLDQKPVVANHLNINRPAGNKPARLSFSEVNTLFHEFGHALHGLLSDVNYPRFSGTTVPRDFVEFPSQVHEMWMTWPEVINNYARHAETGEVLPQAMIDKIKAAEKFNQGYASAEYLAATLLDLAWHKLSHAEALKVDNVLRFEAQALANAGVKMPYILPRYRSTYFSHIFAGGYSAGYYSYIWSQVLDADTVEWFKANGGLSAKNGAHFSRTLLSRGGSKDPMQLYRDFRGRDPRLEPLLERLGFQ